MSKYIKIADMPGVAPGKWLEKVTEWERIPPGEALEITLPEGRSAPSLSASIANALQRGGSHLRVVQRQGHIFIINEAKP